MKDPDQNTQFGIALIQLKVVQGKETNIARAEQLIRSAVDLYHPQLVVLPEYFNMPIGLKTCDGYAEDDENSETVSMLKALAKELSIDIIGGSIPTWVDMTKTMAYNTCFCIDKNGDVKTVFKKVHLFDVFLPQLTAKESSKVVPGDTFGIFETDYAKIGIGICYDIRFAEYAMTLKKSYNVDILVYPAAFGPYTGPGYWELLGRSRAMDNQVYVALCSQSRDYENPSAYQCHGHSMLVDPFGVVEASTGYEEGIVYSKIDLKKNKQIQSQIPIWKQKREDLYDLILKK